MTVKPIPDGYHTITPYLVVDGAQKCIDFLTKAFQAKVLHCMNTPDGLIKHAEVQIGDSRVMIADGRGEEFQAKTTMLYLYVTDTDATYKQAMAAGGISIMEPADQFYGDRNAGVQDPVGNAWWIGTHIKDVPEEEMARLAKEQHCH